MVNGRVILESLFLLFTDYGNGLIQIKTVSKNTK